jgi:hypothetical protein
MCGCVDGLAILRNKDAQLVKVEARANQAGFNGRPFHRKKYKTGNNKKQEFALSVAGFCFRYLA